MNNNNYKSKSIHLSDKQHRNLKLKAIELDKTVEQVLEKILERFFENPQLPIKL